MPPSPPGERTGLLASVAAGGALGVLGVVWGLASGSQMILLDGAYAVIGIALSLLLLRASHVSAAVPDGRHHYGRHASTPIAVGIQGLVLLGTLLFAGLEAVAVIREGGSALGAGSGVVYSAVVTAASLAVWWWLRRRAGASDLLDAEATAWGVAGLRGAGMILGFSAMWALAGTAWDGAVPYIDPGMVLATCVLFAPAPVGMVRRTVAELMERAPARDVQEPVLAAVDRVHAAFGLADPEVRLSKVGPRLYVEVEAVTPPQTTIAREHEAREGLRRELAALPYDVWLTFELVPAGRPAAGDA
jgi:predicted Co/Zn/Cd cation transporter (cation efflux family)